MQRRTYVNKSSDSGREFAGAVFVIALIGMACAILLCVSGGDCTTKPKSEADDGSRNPSSTARAGGMMPSTGDGTYFNPPESEMRHLWEMIRTSPHIAGNKLYSAVIANVDFKYLADNDGVNAFAAMHSPGGLGQGQRPVLCLLGGYVRISRMLALAYAAEQAGVANAMPKLVGIWRELTNGCPEATVKTFVEETGLSEVARSPEILVKAKEISSGMILATLAHEAGHHALGHLHGRVDTGTREVSRNQEREADSFEASIMSVSPFGEFMLNGDILYYAIDAKVGGGGYTHPYSEERFVNLVKANPVLAKAIGLWE